jgi:hypothetical protein
MAVLPHDVKCPGTTVRCCGATHGHLPQRRLDTHFWWIKPFFCWLVHVPDTRMAAMRNFILNTFNLSRRDTDGEVPVLLLNICHALKEEASWIALRSCLLLASTIESLLDGALDAHHEMWGLLIEHDALSPFGCEVEDTMLKNILSPDVKDKVLPK